MGRLLLYVVCGLGLTLLGAAASGVRVTRQTNSNLLSGANVTHSTEYDEPNRTLRFRIQVDYGKQPWDSGERTFPTPDGRLVKVSWVGDTTGVRLELVQILPPEENATTTITPAVSATISTTPAVAATVSTSPAANATSAPPPM